MDALHQLYLQLQLLSGPDDASKAQPPFFHPTPTPTPPHAPMLFLPPRPMQGNGFGHGLVPPREDSLMLAGDEFLGNHQFVDGLPAGMEDEDPLMGMSDADLSAFLSDEAGVDSLCVLPPEFLARSLAACQTAMADSPPVPPAGVPSRSSSGSPGLGCARARATDDSPPGAVEEPLTRMSQSSSGSPGLGAQGRATDSPAGGVEDQLTRMSGDDLTALMSDEAAVNPLCVPPELLMRSLVVCQPAMADSPPVHPATVPSQSSSGSPGQGCAQARNTDSPAGGAYQPVPDYQQAASLEAPQQEPDSETAEVARMARVVARCGDKPSTSWSVEEDQQLFRGLSRFAGQDSVIQCLNIASGLAKKTALDVAYRIRWLSDLKKKEAAKQAQLGQEKSALANVTKGKGTKVANKKNNKHPLSKGE